MKLCFVGFQYKFGFAGSNFDHSCKLVDISLSLKLYHHWFTTKRTFFVKKRKKHVLHPWNLRNILCWNMVCHFIFCCQKTQQIISKDSYNKLKSQDNSLSLSPPSNISYKPNKSHQVSYPIYYPFLLYMSKFV